MQSFFPRLPGSLQVANLSVSYLNSRLNRCPRGSLQNEQQKQISLLRVDGDPTCSVLKPNTFVSVYAFCKLSRRNVFQTERLYRTSLGSEVAFRGV